MQYALYLSCLKDTGLQKDRGGQRLSSCHWKTMKWYNEEDIASLEEDINYKLDWNVFGLQIGLQMCEEYVFLLKWIRGELYFLLIFTWHFVKVVWKWNLDFNLLQVCFALWNYKIVLFTIRETVFRLRSPLSSLIWNRLIIVLLFLLLRW